MTDAPKGLGEKSFQGLERRPSREPLPEVEGVWSGYLRIISVLGGNN